MAVWITPKTDWTPETPVNYKDYNRIKNNLSYLHEKVSDIWGEFQISDMGEDLTSVRQGYYADMFNAFEENLEVINQNMIIVQSLGIRQTFYDNGVFISATELNRIESGTLLIKHIIEGWEAGKIRLAFRLGAPKGLYI